MPLHLPRRRTLAKIGLFLLAGAVVNVAVAWGCALAGWRDLSKPIRWSWRLTRTQGAVWPKPFPASMPAPPPTDPLRHRTVVVEGMGRTVHTMSMSRSRREGEFVVDESWGGTVIAAGVPLRSMRGALYMHIQHKHEPRPQGAAICGNAILDGMQATHTKHGVFTLSDLGVAQLLGAPPFARRRIPLIPRPLGFTVNTALYAAIVYPFFWLLGMFRASRRLARGLCPRCKYDIRDLDTCPECGTAIRRKTVAP